MCASRRRRKLSSALRLFTMLVLAGFAAIQMTGCSGAGGSGGSGGGGSGGGASTTPPGSYTVQVTASGPAGAIQSANIALTVQ